MRLAGTDICLSDEAAAGLLEAVHSRRPVLGLTHGFYRYPARFSPSFAAAAIEAFTEPGDLVLDPFVGGGTGLVEARVLGRPAIGTDINGLAIFVSRVKTTLMPERDRRSVAEWSRGLGDALNLRSQAIRPHDWIQEGYQRNISGRKTWPIRKTIELALTQLEALRGCSRRDFARCALLKTGQWALDCRRVIPSAGQFRKQLEANVTDMLGAAEDFAWRAQEADQLYDPACAPRTMCIRRSAIGMEFDSRIAASPTPKLILTSPPYPGVHVLYHRWQVEGRRETPAPYWIAKSLDSRGGSFYTLGDRGERDLTSYYRQIERAFASLARIADEKTVLVQMLAFSHPSWQLPAYLKALSDAGFREVQLGALANGDDGRLWRRVPNRKWYADQRGAIPSSLEVVLFHTVG